MVGTAARRAATGGRVGTLDDPFVVNTMHRPPLYRLPGESGDYALSRGDAGPLPAVWDQQPIDHQTTILVVEPDPGLAQEIVNGLESRGYRAQTVGTGREAKDFVRSERPDLIALDLILPDTDGLVLLGDLKALDPVPVIVLSRTQRRADAVLGFRLGADDFIVRPFELSELEARIQAILRRVPGGAPGVAAPRIGDAQARFDDLVIDAHQSRAYLGDRQLELTPIEFRLLSALVRAPDRILSRKDLIQRVWGRRENTESRALDVHIGRLRKKLRVARRGGPTIIAVRLQAYRLLPTDPDAPVQLIQTSG